MRRGVGNLQFSPSIKERSEMALPGDSRGSPGVRSNHTGREVVKQGFRMRKEGAPASERAVQREMLGTFPRQVRCKKMQEEWRASPSSRRQMVSC